MFPKFRAKCSSAAPLTRSISSDGFAVPSNLDITQPVNEVPLLPIAPDLSIRLCPLTPRQAAHNWATKVSGEARDAPTTVAFMNMRNYMAMIRSRDASQAFSVMDQVYPDGVGLQLARRITSLPQFKRVSGTDTVPLMLSELPAGTRVFLVGGPQGALPRLHAAFGRLFPHLVLAGLQHGFFGLKDEPALAARIAATRTTIVLVGMGSPQQELWVQRNRHCVFARLIVCVGGLFQYWTGDLSRAPRLVRALGLEWLCILVQQPYKLRIYTVDAVCFLARVARLSRIHPK